MTYKRNSVHGGHISQVQVNSALSDLGMISDVQASCPFMMTGLAITCSFHIKCRYLPH